MASDNLKTFPKIPIKNWWTIRAHFRKSLPQKVTGSYLKSALELSSDKAATNLLSPLKQFGLIDENYVPTQRANDWRDDEKYPDVCQEIIEEVYPQEIRDLFPFAPYDKEKITQWFMSTAKLGNGTAAHVAATYILLNEKKLESEIPVTKNKNTKVNKSSGEKSTVESKKLTRKNEIEQKHSDNIAPELHIDVQVHISPDASAEQIEKIFASMSRHLYGKES